MSALGLVLLAIGVGDLVAGGLAGRVSSPRRALLALFTGTGTTFGTALLAGFAPWMSGRLCAVSAVALVVWILPRTRDEQAASRLRWALAGLGLTLFATLALSPWLGTRIGGYLACWMGRLPFPSLAQADPSRAVLGAGVVIFLLASSNAVVRTILALAGTEIQGGENRLRGGRYIGTIERLLIFGLAAAGEPTAAALVVSAKSILRFPELSRTQRVRTGGADEESPVHANVDIITEYFLLGSLVSWFLALAPVMLLR